MSNITVTLADFKNEMDEKGWFIFNDFLPLSFTKRMVEDLENSYKICRAIQIKNKVEKDTEYTLHHLIGQGDSYIEFIDLIEPLNPYFEAYFKGKYILNSFGGAINTARASSYAHRIHRDIRSYSGELPLLLNTLFMLDNFTAQNGSTYLMPGSHRLAEKPSEEVFEKAKVQAIANAGSLLVFDSNLWHRGGDNSSEHSRRSVTPMFCKPYVKQQYDYSRFLGYDKVVNMSHFRKQILGYYARLPENLDQWYQPPEQRMYRPDQG